MPQQPKKISGTHQAGQVESSVIKRLQSLREKSGFRTIVSTTDDSSQTLAHLSARFGYISLLQHLVEWEIDLTVADVSGLTALHWAYLKGDWESARILLWADAPQGVKDKLGRLPRDLAPEGSGLEGLDFVWRSVFGWNIAQDIGTSVLNYFSSVRYQSAIFTVTDTFNRNHWESTTPKGLIRLCADLHRLLVLSPKIMSY